MGKASPIHLFSGSFELAATRFSGRGAPARPDAGIITKEGYSHEVISAGFWLGDGEVIKDATFTLLPHQNPPVSKTVLPAKAFYGAEKNEFFLMYDEVRLSKFPEQALPDIGSLCSWTLPASALPRQSPRQLPGAGQQKRLEYR
jgi:hypothetical protein